MHESRADDVVAKFGGRPSGRDSLAVESTARRRFRQRACRHARADVQPV